MKLSRKSYLYKVLRFCDLDEPSDLCELANSLLKVLVLTLFAIYVLYCMYVVPMIIFWDTPANNAWYFPCFIVGAVVYLAITVIGIVWTWEKLEPIAQKLCKEIEWED